ncbi:hypothetical protein Tco_0201536 [Tanacetum coccineum]
MRIQSDLKKKSSRHWSSKHLKWQSATFRKDENLEDEDDYMAPLPTADQRHPWLRYQLEVLGSEDDMETVFFGIWITHGAGVAEDGFGAMGWQRQAPEKVTDVDLFYLGSMDRGAVNVPHLLAQYLFRHVEGRKSGARLSGRHFIGRLAMHFGLVSDEGLRGLQAAAAGAHGADEAGLATEEGAQEIPAPAQAPPPAPQP